MTETSSGAGGGHGHPTAPAGAGPRPPAAREAYAFACMNCGYGWEQSYDIEHREDARGGPAVEYRSDGERVPSPLTAPVCRNCGGHLLRIMRAGRVAATRCAPLPGGTPASPSTAPATPAGLTGRQPHRRLAALLHQAFPRRGHRRNR